MSRKSLVAAAILLSLFCSQALAEDPPGQIETRYRIYTHGFHVADAEANYRLLPWGYGIQTHLTAGGLLGWLVRMDINTTASGKFEGQNIVPLQYDSRGYSRGTQRHIAMSYRDHTPVITALSPEESDREPVGDDLRHGTIDTLSAAALLINSMQKDGKCNGSANVFDGLRLTAMEAHGPFSAALPDGMAEFMKGPVLRCDFSGHQIAGFVKDSRHLDQWKAVHPGAAWFENFPGIGLVAVRVEFEHPKIGKLTAILESPPKKF
ncbi:DUF3108 domain-containing protein [Brytella acorum]|uniref:DUF3108 domain-containing protein n=1 Tax=Brytella acorum TaxID=2959299 RepID=A0AA35UEM2_9PROT|nr:DUF3108 domain-containing protein [Brytella acorum]MDF3624497.1 DUF3108 domain-containing protein [Brytella acorum]CAI9119653.1 DUF3108 domain-containing protein [Brytella acorum]